MHLDPPDDATLAQIAADTELGITPADLPVYAAAAEGLLASWNTVAGLYADTAPTPPERSWTKPAAAENPFGGWYVQTEIQETTTGPLAGVRVAIKDNVSVAGVPMMNGSHTVDGFVPSEDATVVRRLLSAGATIAGKSVCEDLCFSGGSHTTKSGVVRNPWDETRSAGGSSSGSGALVGGGEVDMALGGDQGGSIRIPAAYCGAVGHKPTHGLVPYTGAFPIEATIDHLGPITRSVRDAALMLSVIAGVDGGDPRQPTTIDIPDYVGALDLSVDGLRIGYLREGFGHANSEPEVDDAVRRAADAFRDAGMAVSEVSVPWHLHGPAIWDVISVEGATWQMVDGNAYGLNWKGHYDPELIAYYGKKWRTDPSRFSETVKLVTLAGRYALANGYGSHYAMARNLENRLAAAYDAALDDHDVLVMPTLPLRATPLPAADAPVADVLGRALEMLPNTTPFDVTGHPACSVPVGLVDALPVGLMIVGKRFDDTTVLRVAHAIEKQIGTLPVPTAARSHA
ncbi:amidase [Gordonia sp. CPCC 205515]|uniref:amidase n=1 Tax=Gordonia sp. CPCC 205515 TaxID=3140791 RepID=UPI003AF3C524